MTQFFCRWRGAKWQTGFTGTLLFPVQVFRESEHARNTWRLIMLLSCSTVNILPKRTDDMTFAIHFTSIYACFLSACLHLSFFTFASKSSLPWQPGSIFEKSLLSPCFVQCGCFSHLYTKIQNRSIIWWQTLKSVNKAEPCWDWIFGVFDWTALPLNTSLEVIIHLVPCFSIDLSSFCGPNLEQCALLLWLKL